MQQGIRFGQNSKVLRSKECFAAQSTVILLLICGLASSCDLAYLPELCNGFEQVVHVKAIWQESKRGASTTIDSKGCKTLSLVSSEAQDMREDSQFQRVSISKITIFSLQNEILAIYEGAADKAMRVGLNHTPHWLISKEGLFYMSHEQESDWERNIDGIQKKAVVFFPNLLN